MSYIKDLRKKIHLSEPPSHDPLRAHERKVELDQETFDSLDDYTRSCPTSPTAWRIYKKNHGWRASSPDNWFVFIVINAPDGDGQLHVPYRAILT